MRPMIRPRPFARAALTLASPLMEKNPAKSGPGGANGPAALFSMSRLVVLAFAVALVRQLWRQGVAGWPESTLSIAVVLALPLVNILERSRPGAALAMAKALLSRFGEGSARAARDDDAAASTSAAA